MSTNWAIWTKWINSQQYNLSKLKQEESETLNRQVTASEIEAAIKKLPVNKSPGPGSFTGKFY